MLRNRKSSKLTAGFFLHKLPLTIDDTENEQGQQDGGQGAADDSGQSCVPGAGGCGRDPHEVDLAGTWKPQDGISALSATRGPRCRPRTWWPPLVMAFVQNK